MDRRFANWIRVAPFSRRPDLWASRVLVVGALLGAGAAGAATPSVTTWTQTRFSGPTSEGGDYFGYACEISPDLDGDGYGDLLVGAYGVGSYAGAVYAYPGASGGIDPTLVQTVAGDAGGALLGYIVSATGDLDGDGFGDVLVPDNAAESTRVLYGGPRVLGAGRTDRFGPYPFTQAFAGDLDGDGFSDVISLISAAEVVISYGAASGIDTSRDQSLAMSLTTRTSSVSGYHVGPLGDVNGDGFPDAGLSLVLSDSGYGGCYDGWLVVFYGSAGGVDEALTTQIAFGMYSPCRGATFAGVGDLDGDGFADVAIGEDEAELLVAYGSAAGLDPAYTTIAIDGVSPSLNSRYLGAAGDLTGDGVADLLIGNYLSTIRGYLLPGDPALGFDVAAAQAIELTAGEWGSPVFAVGDLDADGDDDIALCIDDDGVEPFLAGAVVVLTNPGEDRTDTGHSADTGDTADTGAPVDSADSASDSASDSAGGDSAPDTDWSGDSPSDSESGEDAGQRSGCGCASSAGKGNAPGGGWVMFLAAASAARRRGSRARPIRLA